MTETEPEIAQNQEGAEQSGKFFRPKRRSLIIMVLLFVAFYVGFAFLAGWKFATVLLVCLTAHEVGHLWAMWRCGTELQGLYFLPGLGVAAMPASEFDSRADEAYIAIMGPVWGMMAGVVAYGLHVATGLPEFASTAWLCVFINLFNLIPVAPLDGGRVIRSATHGLSPQLSVWVCGLLYVLSIVIIYQFSWLFACLIIFFGTQQLMHHRLMVCLEDDYRRIKAALENGGLQFDQLRADAITILSAEADSDETAVREARARMEPTPENIKLLDGLAAVRGRRFSLWPLGFFPVTPDHVFASPFDLILYLSPFKVSPALSVGRALMYIGLFLLLAVALVVLGTFCHEVLPVAQWLQPLQG